MKVLIIDDVHEILPQGLTALGYQVNYQPHMQRSELLQTIEPYVGLVVRTKTEIDATVLSHGANLKWIARAGAGVDNIDTQYCDAHSIAYVNAGEANADAVGEHTLAMLLSLITNLQKADKEVRKGIWDRQGNTGWELKGKTLGIIGYGNTGKAVAQKLAGFGVTVLAYDKYLVNYGNAWAAEASMQIIQQQADIITFHVPLTAETIFMVNEQWITECKKSIVLLNLSRGKVVKLEALLKALEQKKVIAAGLDVLENEKLNELSEYEVVLFEQLCSKQNVVLSPHIGGWTVESYRKIGEVLLQKIKELTLT
jgi:D-3-phosphoglycerate dehydrogenase / 2-oxoglutarate reductase